MTSLVLGTAGALVGSAFGPLGAQIGWALGSAAGAIISQPDGPSPGDLSAPQIQQGAALPRVYGRVVVPANPAWVSEFRATANETGGKGGPPEGSAGYTYSLDMLATLADGSNVIAITRIWVNKKLVWTALADSDLASISASAVTDVWEAVELFTGGPAQMPWGVYETAVTTPEAVAYRHQCTIGITGLQCGGSKTPPLVEVEVITEGTQTTVPIERLLWEFDEAGASFAVSALTQSQTFIGNWDAYDGLPREFTVLGNYSPLTYSTQGPITESLGSDGISSGSGNVDSLQALILIGAPGPYQYLLVNASGGVVQFTPHENKGGQQLRFAINSGLLYVGSTTFGSQTIEKYTCAGAYESSSPVLSDYVQSVAATPTYCYARNAAATSIYQLSISGMSLIDTFAVPVGAGDCSLITNGENLYCLSDDMVSATLWLRQAGAWVVVMSGLVNTRASQVSISRLPHSFDGTTLMTLRCPAHVTDSPATFLLYEATIDESWTPNTVDLQDIVDAELLTNPGIDPADHDTSGLAGIPVRGFKAIGPPASTIAQLADIFWFDLVPDAPLRYVPRGEASVATIPFEDTGVGVDQAAKPFTGIKRANDAEIPAVVGLVYPNALATPDTGFERGDRLTTDGPDLRKATTQVVLEPSEAKGRAITATLMARAASQTAAFALSDKYAKLQPGDACTVSADDASSFALFMAKLTYADGVRQCEWQLYDTSALVETGLTDETYTPSVTVAPAGTAEGLPLDIPLLLDANDSPGYYAAVKTSDGSSARFMESADDVSYPTATTFTTDSVFGIVTAKVGSFPALNLWDEGSSLTVDVGDGTLSSSTRAALLADRTVNAFAVGVDGRWCLGQFRTATIVSTGIYTLTGLLLGAKGSEQYADNIVAGDDFCLLTTALQYLPRTTSLIGVSHYWKAVPQRRSPSTITGEATTVDAISLKPLSPVRARAARDVATGDIALSWARRTRYDVRFGGDLGDACPLGEAAEQYRVRLYTSGAFTTLLRDLGVVSTNTAPYTAAQLSADSKALTDPVYADIRMVSAVVGEGYELQDTL